jgi:hypothetical protein
MNSPVGTIVLSSGFNVTGSAIFALRSIPADFSVAYAGVGKEDLFTICTFMRFIID